MNKVLIIGCGHMGSALLDAWQNLNLSDQKQKEQEKSEDLGEFPF